MAECISEEELWSRFRSENDASARENLILKYMGLVKYVVDRLSMRPPSTIEYNDLYSCGIIGLVSAVDRFDPSLGNKFQTYAVCRIRGEILDESKRKGWVPRPLYKKNIEIYKEIHGFWLSGEVLQQITSTIMAGTLGLQKR